MKQNFFCMCGVSNELRIVGVNINLFLCNGLRCDDDIIICR